MLKLKADTADNQKGKKVSTEPRALRSVYSGKTVLTTVWVSAHWVDRIFDSAPRLYEGSRGQVTVKKKTDKGDKKGKKVSTEPRALRSVYSGKTVLTTVWVSAHRVDRILTAHRVCTRGHGAR